VISDDESVSIITKYETCAEASKALLSAALQAGSTDNISIMVLKL
jgi:serine/threonine protein phosphatase PrpC